MANELQNTLTDIDKAEHSKDKQFNKVYTDVLALYKADSSNNNFKNDLNTVNQKLIQDGFPTLQITDVSANAGDDGRAGQNLEIHKSDKSVLTYDAGGKVTSIQYADSSSKSFGYTGDEITSEQVWNAGSKKVSDYTKNSDGSWNDVASGTKVLDTKGDAEKIDMQITAEGIFMKSVQHADGTTNFDATNSDGSKNNALSAFTESTNDSPTLPTTLSGTDAAQLIQSLSPELLSKITDASGMIDIWNLQSVNAGNPDDQTKVSKLLAAFDSMSKDGITIDPDYVARNAGIELSTTQISKYNLLKFLFKDPELSKTINNDKGDGIDLSKVQQIADELKNLDPNSAEAKYWTPERRDIIKQLSDSSALLSADSKIIPFSTLAAGAKNEMQFRRDLVDFLGKNPDVQAQITDDQGLVDKTKLHTYLADMSKAHDQILFQLQTEFGAYTTGPTLDVETLKEGAEGSDS